MKLSKSDLNLRINTSLSYFGPAINAALNVTSKMLFVPAAVRKLTTKLRKALIQMNEKKQIHIRMPKELKFKIQLYAMENSLSLNDAITLVLLKYFKKYTYKTPKEHI